jgi:hypothetical protein
MAQRHLFPSTGADYCVSILAGSLGAFAMTALRAASFFCDAG